MEPTLAQQPIAGRVLPETFAPQKPRQGNLIDLGRFAGAPVPPDADKITFVPGGIVIIGDRSPIAEPENRLRETIAELARAKKAVSLADIYKFVSLFEQEMSDAGYILFRAVIPPQEIVPGKPFKVKFIDGHLEEVDVKALSPAIADAVHARLAPLLRRGGVKRGEIERALLIAGDLAGLTLRSTFAPGQETGGAKLIIDGGFKSYIASIGIDRFASDSVGSWEIVSTLAFNSLFRQGEQIYFAYQGDPDTYARRQKTLRIGALGATVPIGNDGMTISPELVWAQIRPLSQPFVPDTQNDMARGSLKLSYPAIRYYDRTVTFHTAVEGVSQRLYATQFNVALSSDSYAAWRSGVDIQFAPSYLPPMNGSLKFSQGVGPMTSLFSGVQRAPPTHVGARTDFSKLNATYGVGMPIGPVTASLALRGQLSFAKPLFNSEQLSLDAFDAVSALSPGRYAVDQGGTARVEFSRAFPLANAAALPYVFGAIGGGYVYNSTAVESSKLDAKMLGFGLKLRALAIPGRDMGVSFGIEFGHAWINAFDRSESNRVTASITTSF